MTNRKLTAEENEALEAFAAAHGRRWKEELSMVYWYNARIWQGPKEGMGPLLHGLRNEFGPTWLYDSCKLPKRSKAPAVRVSHSTAIRTLVEALVVCVERISLHAVHGNLDAINQANAAIDLGRAMLGERDGK